MLEHNLITPKSKEEQAIFSNIGNIEKLHRNVITFLLGLIFYLNTKYFQLLDDLEEYCLVRNGNEELEISDIFLPRVVLEVYSICVWKVSITLIYQDSLLKNA